MKTKLEILKYIFDPIDDDQSNEKQDLQLAITLNPSIDRILFAMEEYGKQQYNQALEDAAEKVQIKSVDEYQGEEFRYLTIDKQSILKLKKSLSSTD